MKKSIRYSVIVALIAVALAIGVYISAALFFRERLHVVVITLALCCIGGLLGVIVTRPRAQVISVGLIILGLIAAGSGLYLLHTFHFHERAYSILGVGILCFFSGLAGLIIRSISDTLFGMTVLGIIALSAGLYFLIGSHYHGRAYVMLGIGAAGILGSLITGSIIRYKSRTVLGSS